MDIAKLYNRPVLVALALVAVVAFFAITQQQVSNDLAEIKQGFAQSTVDNRVDTLEHIAQHGEATVTVAEK